MKIEFTEAEVEEIVKDFVIKVTNHPGGAEAITVEFDTAYGYLRKVVATVKTVVNSDA